MTRGQCKYFTYCGKRCQTLHWKHEHKSHCEPPFYDTQEYRSDHESSDAYDTAEE